MEKSEKGNGLDSLKSFLKDNPTYDIYDYSQLELADQCLRKYQFKYISGMTFPNGIEAMFSSKLIHPLCAQLFSQSQNDSLLSPQTWLKLFNEYSESIRGLQSTQKQKNCYTIDVAKSIYNRMNQRRFDHFAAIDPKLTTSEIIYWRVLPNIKNAIWLSKPDIIINDPSRNWKATIEVKTSTFEPNRDLNPFDRQILSQAWTTEFNLQVRLFNLIKIGMDNKVERTDCFVENNLVDNNLLGEWLAEIQFSIEVIQKAKETGIWPKRAPKSCMDFGKPCPMTDFCVIGPGRQLLMDTRPKSNPWEYLGL